MRSKHLAFHNPKWVVFLLVYFLIFFLSSHQTLFAQTGITDKLIEEKYFKDTSILKTPISPEPPISFVDDDSLVVSANMSGYVGISIGAGGTNQNFLGIGLNTLEPNAALHVRTTSAIPQLDITYERDGSAKSVLYIDANGNVGVGNKSASQKLLIRGENYASGTKKKEVEIAGSLKIRSAALGMGEKQYDSSKLSESNFAPNFRTRGTIIGKSANDTQSNITKKGTGMLNASTGNNDSNSVFTASKTGLYLIVVNISDWNNSTTSTGSGKYTIRYNEADLHTLWVKYYSQLSWNFLKTLEKGERIDIVNSSGSGANSKDYTVVGIYLGKSK